MFKDRFGKEIEKGDIFLWADTSKNITIGIVLDYMPRSLRVTTAVVSNRPYSYSPYCSNRYGEFYVVTREAINALPPEFLISLQDAQRKYEEWIDRKK